MAGKGFLGFSRNRIRMSLPAKAADYFSRSHAVLRDLRVLRDPPVRASALFRRAVQHALQDLLAGEPVGRVVRAGGDTRRRGCGAVIRGVAEVACGRLRLSDRDGARGICVVRRLVDAVPVRHHEDAPIRAILRAQATADAVILDDNLEVLAAVDRIHGAARHAVRIGARAARRGDEHVAELHPVAKQARDGHAVRFRAVLLDAAARAFIAPRAEIQIEREDAPPLIKSLRHEFRTQRIGLQIFPQPRERDLHEPPPHGWKFADHFQKSHPLHARKFDEV